MINLFLGVKIRNLLPKSQNCLAVERTLITVEMLMKSSLQVHCWPRRLMVRSMQDRHVPIDFVNFSGIRQIFTFCFKEFWYSSYLFITKTSISLLFKSII
ncbi:hypothetical protein NC652_006731 [Populus alba x Populus x berolinensis]|nr:hypothetical protein NC652_006731 [Populus alba x Populus x berolinensis]